MGVGASSRVETPEEAASCFYEARQTFKRKAFNLVVVSLL